MALNRRQFVILTAAAAAGCKPESEQPAAAPSSRPTTAPSVSTGEGIDAGPLDGFSEEGIYDAFRDRGFFVIRRDKKLSALSSICTHKGCKVRAQTDRSFLCKCHGSTFDPDGKVTKGPAKLDLPRLSVAEDGQNHLRVNVPVDVDA